MNLVGDEGVDRPIVNHLREQGHSVVYFAESSPGAEDEVVLSKAAELSAPLITTDKDFGELVFRRRLTTFGVVLLRLAGLQLDVKARIVASALRDHADEIAGAFTVISPGQVRVRRASSD